MRWFGESWGAPVNEDCESMPTPVGSTCAFHRCEKPIVEGDCGFALPFSRKAEDSSLDEIEVDGVPHLVYHHACQMEMVLGPNWRELLA